MSKTHPRILWRGSAGGLVFSLLLAFQASAAPPIDQAADSSGHAAWLAAQQAFLAAPTSQQERRWGVLLTRVSAYLSTPSAWTTQPSTIEKALNIAGHRHIGYALEGWRTSVGSFRVVTISGGSSSILYDNSLEYLGLGYGAQILLWAEPGSPVRSQILWTAKGISLRGGIIPSYRLVSDLRAWRGSDGVLRMVAIIQSWLPGSDGADPTALGLALPGGSHPWMVDSLILPLDIFADHPPSDGFYHQAVSFVDATGRSIDISIDLQSTVFAESHCCPHVTVQRVLTRVDDRYVPGSWKVIPSPYASIVAVVTLAKDAGPQGCNARLLRTTHLIQNDEVAQAFCATQWVGAISASGPDTYPRNGPVVFTVAAHSDNVVNVPAPGLAVTLIREHGVWVMTSVHRVARAG